MGTLFTPTVFLSLVVLLALIHLWRNQKEPRRRLWWVAIPFLLLILSNSPPVAYLALGSLEWQYPPSEEVPEEAGAIVVLAGSVSVADQLRARPELGPDTLYRCLHGVALQKKSPHCLMLLSGGSVNRLSGPSAANVMREFVVGQNVDVSRIVVEEQSQNTYENAVESCKLLRERGIHRVVLVTEASHMPRAAACFRKQGLEVTPSPCRNIATEYHLRWIDFIPDVKSAMQVDTAWHEWVGTTIYWLRGRI